MITVVGFILCAAVAAVARLALSAPLNAHFDLPLGTLLVNVSGSLALGLLAAASPAVVTAVGAGAVGTYTTFSTFSVEASTLARRTPALAVIYVVTSVLACTAAAWLGLVVAG